MNESPLDPRHTEGAPSRWAFFFRVFLLAATFLAAGLLVWQLSNLLLLAFGAILVAVVLRSFAALIEKYTPLHARASLVMATVSVALLAAGFTFLLGAQIQAQFAQLLERLPELIQAAEDRLGIENLEERLAEQIQQSVGRASLLYNVAGWSSAIVGGLANLGLVVIAGIYLAADPQVYRRGLLLLFPQRLHSQAAETLDVLYSGLQLWLLGQLLSMVLVGMLVAVGLWLLGIPSALARGVIAGLVEMIEERLRGDE
jgi:predicted PurR-regulated permease PerM